MYSIAIGHSMSYCLPATTSRICNIDIDTRVKTPLTVDIPKKEMAILCNPTFKVVKLDATTTNHLMQDAALKLAFPTLSFHI